MEIVDCENVIYEINKSKFIGYAYNVTDVEKVNEILKKINAEHEKATHVCYAYVIETPNQEKCCDDGEPDGTAGRPILEVVKKSNLTNILLIVVRYFGGIKLGAGGLLRAYSTCARNTINSTKIIQLKNVIECVVSCKIGEKNILLDYINKNNFKILNQTYGMDFKVKIQIEYDEEDKLKLLDEKFGLESKELKKVAK